MLARPFLAAAWMVAPTEAARPHALDPGMPVQQLAFYSLMGLFLAILATLVWQQHRGPLDWQFEKPLAHFHPLCPGRPPPVAVECCLRGIRLVHAGQVALGAQVMLVAYRQAPTVQMIYNLGLAWHLSASPLAETAYRAAIQLDPAHRDARFNLARLLAESGRPHEALLAYRALVETDPSDGTAWFNLGTLYGRLGMGEAAFDALRRARRLLGDDAACRHNFKLARRLWPWWRRWVCRGAGRKGRSVQLSPLGV